MKKLFTFFAAMLVAVAVNATILDIAPNSPQASDNIRREIRDHISAGDTLRLADGTYTESESISADKNVVIIAAEGATPVVQLASGAYIKVSNNANVVISGIKFDGATNSTQYAVRPYDATNTRITIENCEFYGFLKNIITCGESNHTDYLLINNCYFYNNKRSSVYFPASTVENQQTSKEVIIKNSTFANNDASSEYIGIIDIRSYGLAETSDIEVIVDHCTFYNNITMNTDYAGVCTRIITNTTVSNCIFAHSEAYERRATYLYKGSAINCMTYNLTKDASQDGHTWMTTRTNCSTADPIMPDAANGDFTLSVESPAIDAGSDAKTLGDPRWWPEITYPETDFADGYFFDGSKASLSGNIWYSDTDSLYYNDQSVCGTATWKINATRACIVEATANFKTGSASGAKLQIVILDDEDNQVGDTLSQDYYEKDGDKAFPGSITIPAAGVYTIKLLNAQSWSSAKLRGITLTYAGDIPTPKNWCDISIFHEMSPSASPDSYARLKLIDNEDGTITFTISNDAEKNTKTFDYLQINPLGIIVGADAEIGTSSISGTYTVPENTKTLTLEILWSNPSWNGRWMVQNLVVDLESDIFCEKPEAPTTYTINITEMEKGTVVSNMNEAEAGAMVTLTITPADGYELDELAVGELSVSINEAKTQATFVMPAEDVTVTATFKEKEPVSWCNISISHEKSATAAANSFALFSITDNEDGTITFTIANDSEKNEMTFDYLQINPIGIIVGADAEEGTSSISATYTVPESTKKLTLEILWSNPSWNGRWMVQNLVVDLENDEFCEKPIEPVAVYSDFEIDLRNGQLGTDANNPNNKYLAIDGKNYTYTDDAPAVYNAYLTSARYNDAQHGYVSLVATIPVAAGNYKITVGNCTYNGTNGAVKNADGTETLDIIDKNGQTITAIETPKNCYHQNTTENITSVWFVAEAAQTIRIVCPQYAPYIKVEQVEEVPSAVTVYTVTFLNAEGAEGVVPATLKDVAPNTIITLPYNFSMYKEGQTFAAWDDGDDTYAPGSEYEVKGDVTFVATYEDNKASLASRTEPVTIKWEFSQSKGVAPINVSGAKTFVVAQATIGSSKIDVQLPIDATAGKFVNSSNSWTQINPGVIFSIPSAKGAVITYKQYDNGATSTPEINVPEEGATYDLVAAGTSGQLYYEYVQVVLPASEATAISNTEAAAKAQKMVENGQIVILKNGIRYNVLGTVLK